MRSKRRFEIAVKKSPGPDWFTFEFFQKYWNIVDQDIVGAVLEFFASGKFPPGCNSTFIALIPKTNDTKVVKDFRPISLIESIYKIIAKILANRLSFIMSDLVSDVQTTFVTNRQILDGPFILNDLISWCKHKKINAMIIKISVDFEKAFDSVRWDYLDDVLNSFGFGEKWRSWISGCLDSAMGSVLVNGLKINLLKRKLTGIGVNKEDIDMAASIVGCSTFFPPFQYLGVNAGASMSWLNSWKEITANVSSRLSKWKLKTLSNGGRLTLLKSVLTTIPIYHMSLFKVPAGILKDMESIRRIFFNGIDKFVRKMVWIECDKIMASKKNGGRRVSSLYATNRALLFKWVWRFLTQEPSLWSRFIKAIHGSKEAMDFQNHSFKGSIWHDITRASSSLNQKGVDLLSFISRKLGNDISVAEKMEHSSFSFSFHRLPRGGIESEQYSDLSDAIFDLILPQIQDRWAWSLNTSEEFSVSSVRNVIDDVYLPKLDVPTRWIKEIPIKVNILAWKISLDGLPTRSNLSSRGLDILSIICPSCN
nr:hypothetical protein [Tanacetum cinerariifolium]